MEKCVTKIEVRTLNGETSTVSGVKLSLQSQVGSLKMEPGEFMVLIPFTKKDRPQTPKHDSSETSSNAAEQTSSSKKFVDSTYTEMMQDLASFREEETSNIDNNQPKCYTDFGNVSRGPLEAKRKRVVDCDSQQGGPYDFLWTVWRSKNKNAFEGQNSEKFVEVLQSVTCLLDPHSGKCMLLREASMRSSNGGLWESNDNDCSCLCPVWLKKIMEAFAFLSIFCAYLHLRKEKVTLSRVKDALNQLGKFGVRVSIEDIEHLSVLCPKVVQLANDDMESENYRNSIVIINAPTEERYQVEVNLRIGQKDMSLSKIFNALKKWESSFKSNLWEAIKLLMCKIRKRAISLSLEDLLIFAKEHGTVVSENGGKRPRRNSASASSSHERRCNDTSQLLPLEMIEHLRKGIGSYGQVISMLFF
ncbi:hypothetical protein Patl1_18952 [Pistacia atlantica]|uniref:Uncharacterized protein n=1 Tax=Pistacia atlantica TaxID=434234 RepID=A0ACC1BZU3_9ROSI|nr:hypothetical protein Patl1_18952 [Pistacia atlantica]